MCAARLSRAAERYAASICSSPTNSDSSRAKLDGCAASRDDFVRTATGHERHSRRPPPRLASRAIHAAESDETASRTTASGKTVKKLLLLIPLAGLVAACGGGGTKTVTVAPPKPKFHPTDPTARQLRRRSLRLERRIRRGSRPAARLHPGGSAHLRHQQPVHPQGSAGDDRRDDVHQRQRSRRL